MIASATFEDLFARFWRIRFARFLVVGVVNTVFGYGVFLALLGVGAGPTPALAMATAIGALFNFMTTGRVVFVNSDAARLWRFILAYALVFVANAVLLEGALRLGCAAGLAQALLLAPCVSLSYLLNRALVFGDATRNA